MSFTKDSAYDLHEEGELRLSAHQAKPSSLTGAFDKGKGWTCALHGEDLKKIVQALAEALASSTAEPSQPDPEALLPTAMRSDQHRKKHPVQQCHPERHWRKQAEEEHPGVLSRNVR
jgi:hypothetical protein